MILYIVAVLIGLLVLAWSADKFVAGGASAARHLGMSPLLIGMLIIGFGTSAPEIVVSIFAAIDESSALALGNAYGSNITNIALILGITALICPIVVRPEILRKELPVLVGVTALAAYQLWDGEVSRWDGLILVSIIFGLMGWSIYESRNKKPEELEAELEAELDAEPMSFKESLMWLVVGMGLLVASSRAIVWGAVGVAQSFGVSDLVIGLTVVAMGTSLPELASSIAAARKGEDDLALGNIIGSNLFNTLAVVGIASAIHPIVVDQEVMIRDVPVMSILTVSLIVMASRFWGKGKIGRWSGALLVLTYVGYTLYLIWSVFQ